MTAFNLVRVPIRLGKLARYAGEQGRTRQENVDYDRGRVLHHLLTEAFGRRALRPFRLLAPSGSQTGNLYAYTEKDGAALRDSATDFALPDQLAVMDIEKITAKRMPSEWREGQRLGFDLQAWPVRRISGPIRMSNGELLGDKPRGGSTEVDAFWLAQLRNPKARIERQETYLDWLDKQLGEAANLDRRASRLARFQRKRVARGRNAIEGPQAVLHGVLTLNNPNAFADLLRRGVGRHRAYGYGMLLLRPPGRAPLRG